MALPAKQRTRTSKRQRASHFALKKITTRKCAKCGEKKLPHRACLNCGSYKGKTALNTQKRTERKKRQTK